jgi:hypothetical protein
VKGKGYGNKICKKKGWREKPLLKINEKKEKKYCKREKERNEKENNTKENKSDKRKRGKRKREKEDA